MKVKFLQMKRVLSSILFVLLLSAIGMTKGYAYDFSSVCVTGQTLYYNITDATNHYVALTCPGTANWNGWSGFDRPTGDVILPDNLQYGGATYTIVSIGNYAFYNCSELTSVQIPNTVTSIGNYAFCDCYNLTSIEIPNSVTLIGYYAFYYCYNMTSIEISNSLTEIEEGAFSSCSGLSSIDLPNSITSIGSWAFSYCSSLTSIEIPSSVTYLGINPFASCSSLEQIVVASDNAYYDSRENCNAIINTNTNELLIGCKNTIIPNSVTSIGDSAFSDCYDLTSIEIPSSVTSIGEFAFNYCYNLSSIEIPNSVTSIGYGAFQSCNGLTSLTIGNSVTTIGGYAFYDCNLLTSIELPNSLTSIGYEAFGYCSSLTSIEIPSSVTYIESNPFVSCNGLEQIVVASDNPNYDSRENCNAIINTSANALVTGCKNTVIPNTVTSIDNEAFYACETLTSIELPNSITSISSSAFYYCTGLTSIEIPNSVTWIGYDAFEYCYGLTSLTIGNSVTSISSYAFYNCNNLNSMTVLAETLPSLGYSVFNYVPTNIPVYVPCSAVEDYQTANGWSNFTNIIGLCSGYVSVTVNPSNGGTVAGAGYYYSGDVCVLTATPNSGFDFANWTENGRVVSTNPVYSFYAHPTTMVANFCSNSPIVFADDNVKALCVGNWDTNGDGELSYAEAAAVTNLGEVFNYNSSITSFDELQYFISLRSIGNSTFYYCSNLTSITLPNTVTSIDSYAFYYCRSLTSIEIPSSVTSIGYDAFYYCDNLTSIEIPSSVTSIGGYAFYYCTGLTSVEIPNSVTSIGDNPFASCSSLEQIVVASDNPNYDSRGNCNAIINTNTNVLLTGCINTVIPNTVTSIGRSAFHNCSMTSIELPDSLAMIGDYAFNNCINLTSIEIPNSVTSIGNYAFYYCTGLTSATIGNSVTSIGSNAFYYCTGLTSATIGNSVTSIGNYAFYYCSSLGSMTLLAETPPSVSNYAFYNVPIYIPVCVPCDAVENYQASSSWNGFTNIIGMCSGEVAVTVNPSEGGSVTGAGYYTGGEVCVLTATANPGFVFINWTENGRVVSMDPVYSFYAHPTTIVANFCSNNPIVFADDNVKALCVDNWDTDGDGELSYAEAAAVTDLGQVFRNNSTITSFDELQYFISLTSIGGSAFYNCTNLTSIEIPNSVTSIGSYAFQSCNGLTAITIGNSVTSIGSYAFYYCYNLTSIELPNSLTSIGNSAFRSCSGLTSIEIPSSLTSIGSSAFRSCSGLTSIEIPSSVTSIGDNPFADCSNLEQIVVDPDNVNYDSRGNCNAIINTSTNVLVTGCKNTVIPNTVTSIGYEAFRSCSGLTSIEIPNSVTSIEGYAFGNCNNLTSIELPNSVTSIGYDAFYYCSGLTSIEIPNSVTSIGYNAFYCCSGLTSVTIGNSVTSIDGWAFYNCYNLTTLEIPNSVTTIGYGAFEYCTGLTSVTIGNSVTLIEGEAFYYCYNMNSLIIGNSVGSIGEYAFNNCSGLNSMTVLAETPPTLGEYAFDYIDRSIPVYVACGTSEAYQNAEVWYEFDNIMELCPGTITAVASPVEGGTVAGGGSFEGGATCTLTATPNEGYYFMNWTENGEVVSIDEEYTFLVTGDRDLVANFFMKHWTAENYQNNMYMIGVVMIDYTEQASPGLELGAFCNGECRGAELPIYDEGRWLYFMTIGGNDGDNITFRLYDHVLQQERDLYCYSGLTFESNGMVGLDNPYEIGFIGMYTVTTMANPSEGGTVSGGGTFYYGNTCWVTATPNEGYMFLNWNNNGEVVSCNTSFGYNVAGDANLEAVFMLQEGENIIGSGTATNSYLPSYSYYNYTLSQQIYTPDEIGVGGDITSISYFNAGVTKTRSYDIYMVHTDKSSFENNTDWITVSEADRVYSGNVTMTQGYWTTIVLDTPFAYNGHSNLAIIVDDNSGYWESPSMYCRVYNANGNQAIRVYSDYTNYDPYNPSAYNGTLHSVKNQIILEITSSGHSRPLVTGWNWWSTYIEVGGAPGLTMLENALGENGLTIMSQNAFVSYNSQTGVWRGTLRSIDNASGYNIKVSESCTVAMIGAIATPEDHPITLSHGWNWMGYPVSVAQTLASAMSGFTPETGDIVNGQNGFAVYRSNRWLPATFMMNPGESYMYYSNATENKTLVYAQGRGEAPTTESEECFWQADRHAYRENLCLMATVEVDGVEQRDETLELGAFVSGECRGSARLYYVEPIDRYIAFLTVTGEDEEQVEFRLMDQSKATSMSNDHIIFHGNAIIGNLDTPFVIHFGAMNGLTEMQLNASIYPNPMDRNMPFTLAIPEGETVVDILITNALGEVVRHNTGSLMTSNITGLSEAGVYLLKVVCRSGNVYYGRLIVK